MHFYGLFLRGWRDYTFLCNPFFCDLVITQEINGYYAIVRLYNKSFSKAGTTLEGHGCTSHDNGMTVATPNLERDTGS